jgi:hypothetical protein
MKNLLAMNMALLDQAITLVRDQPDGLYSRACKEVFSSTIGQHIRHCVEHYVETDTNEALRRLAAIHASLGELSDIGRRLGVMDTGASSPSPSSDTREMQYLLSHTVHHFALIAVIAGLVGVSVPSDFGVAPSTLKHRKSA